MLHDSRRAVRGIRHTPATAADPEALWRRIERQRRRQACERATWPIRLVEAMAAGGGLALLALGAVRWGPRLLEWLAGPACAADLERLAAMPYDLWPAAAVAALAAALLAVELDWTEA